MSLVNDLIISGYLKSPEIIKAFEEIKRADFVLPEDKARAELDAPLPIGHGQTISQPATVAFMLELLRPAKGEKILDVGAGSGWTTALLAQLVGRSGLVSGAERICELKDFAAGNVAKYNFIKNGTVQIFCTDGYAGLPELAPFDKILISASAEEIPEELLKQLKPGGRLVMPLGEQGKTQSLLEIKKSTRGEISKKEYPGFIFVPLVKNLN
ncbi:MAG: protein-L-isoaspartate O-methyltransferase [bacterium]|nr:protein-L-isoaspartate O-methyltransferase [bacterium]